jgi:hypothetical protein
MIAWAGLFDAGFCWDDGALVADNRLTGSLAPSNIAAIFRADLWETLNLPAPASGYYRPLFLLSLAFDQVVLGPEPGPHHLHSLAWHLSTVALLYLLVRKLLPESLLPATAAAALFALHPVQTEAVALIAARNDSMAATCLLGALILLLPERPGPAALVGAAVATMAGMLSKESVVLVPFALGALDFARLGKLGPWRRQAPLVLGLGAALGLRAWAGIGSAAVPDPGSWSLVAGRLPEISATYLGLLAWPHPLTPARHLSYLQPLGELWMPAALCLAVLIGLLWRSRSPRLGWLGVVWALATFAPTLAATLDKGLLGERYLYLPVAGLAVTLAAWIPRNRMAWVVGVAISLALAFGVQQRLPDWKNSRTLWQAAHDAYPSPFTHAGLAFYVNKDGEPEIAKRHYLKAIEGDPPYRDACSSLVMVYLRLQKEAVAVRMARWAMKERGCPPTTDFIDQYSLALAGTGDWTGAARLVREAPHRPTGVGMMVLGADRWMASDIPGLARIKQDWRGTSGFEIQVLRLLRLTGELEAARGFQAFVTDSPQ